LEDIFLGAVDRSRESDGNLMKMEMDRRHVVVVVVELKQLQLSGWRGCQLPLLEVR
jgi:hypothetical protein